MYRVRDPWINLYVRIILVSLSGFGLHVFIAMCVCQGGMWCVSVTWVTACNWNWWENLSPAGYG